MIIFEIKQEFSSAQISTMCNLFFPHKSTKYRMYALLTFFQNEGRWEGKPAANPSPSRKIDETEYVC